MTSVELIGKHIMLIRAQKVMLDSDLAELYGVATKVMVQAVNATLVGFRMISCFSLIVMRPQL